MSERTTMDKDDFDTFKSIIRAGFDAGYEAGKQAVDPDPLGVNDIVKETSFNMCVALLKAMLT